MEYAHYSFKVVGDHLEGEYHEDGEDGPIKQKIVRVEFDDATGNQGEFKVAKAPPPPKVEDGDVPPTPQPEAAPLKFTIMFDFEFHPQSNLRFHLSNSKCVPTESARARIPAKIASPEALAFSCLRLSPSFFRLRSDPTCGSKLQFLAGEDSFVVTTALVKDKSKQSTPNCGHPEVSAWTAVRRGAARRPAASGRADGKKSLLDRYGWYLGIAILYMAYKAITTKAANMALAAQGKKTK